MCAFVKGLIGYDTEVWSIKDITFFIMFNQLMPGVH